MSNKTRGIIGGGGSPTVVNTLDFFTISTLGNSADFGDLTVIRNYSGACSSALVGCLYQEIPHLMLILM